MKVDLIFCLHRDLNCGHGAADQLRAAGGTLPRGELLPGRFPHRPQNRGNPLYFSPQCRPARYLVRDPMTLQSLTQNEPFTTRREAGGCGPARPEGGPEGRAARRPSRWGQAGGRPRPPPAREHSQQGREPRGRRQRPRPKAAPPATQVRCPPGRARRTAAVPPASLPLPHSAGGHAASFTGTAEEVLL